MFLNANYKSQATKEKVQRGDKGFEKLNSLKIVGLVARLLAMAQFLKSEECVFSYTVIKGH